MSEAFGGFSKHLYGFVLFLLTVWILCTTDNQDMNIQSTQQIGDDSFADDLQASIFYFILILYGCADQLPFEVVLFRKSANSSVILG